MVYKVKKERQLHFFLIYTLIDYIIWSHKHCSATIQYPSLFKLMERQSSKYNISDTRDSMKNMVYTN